ncbi:MAG: PD-(D/E)XK nuclease family protein [Candidatus Eremiobacteraeota bacterium]|nr:PD-(D/E)XK nuclease family protein [Candidatus Eremiobacteraeota bacterium]
MRLRRNGLLMSLPIAPARRAAIATALFRATPGNSYLQGLMAAFGAGLIDDLCRMAARTETQAVSDVALARAATEESNALSWAARIMYGARLHLRAAGCQGEIATTGPDLTAATPTAATTSAPGLGAAFDLLHDAGVTQARAPRRLLEALHGINGRGESGVIARLLAAAYSDDVSSLIAALCGPPYSIDPVHLQLALQQPDSAGTRSAREALAAAIVVLPGAAKEPALAALLAFDAAGPQTDTPSAAKGASFSLASAAVAVEQAAREYAGSRGAQLNDSDFDDLVRAAASADRVWSCAPDPLPISFRVATLLDGLARLRLTDRLTLICDGDPGEVVGASLEFEDDRPAPIAWETLATALDVAPEQRERQLSADRMTVEVAVPFASALAAYLVDDAHQPSPSGAHERQYVWPQAESQAVVLASGMTFSASRLNAYVKCPRRWFYEYLCEALDDQASLYATYGRVVHDALEALHRQVRVPNRHAPDLILERLLRELDVAFGKARDDFDSQLEYEVSRMRARRMAEQYVRWLALEAARNPMEIVHVELLQRRRFGEHDFVGYIDRIDRPIGGGPVTIFDYKTGRIDTDAQAYLEKVVRGDEAQLALYYAMRRADGDEIARIALVSLRDPRDDAWMLALDVTDDDGKFVVEREPQDGVLRARCSRADLEASLGALVARCDFLTKRGQPHFPVGEDPPCNFCAYVRACRERPPLGERIFAR